MQIGQQDSFQHMNHDIGLSGAEAAWANKKYHGHHTLPSIMHAEVRRAQIDMPIPLILRLKKI
jgi:hypothetical protein